MTESPKIHFKTVNYILYPNFSKITKSAQTFPKLRKVPKLFQNYEKCPNFSKITKYALIILSKLQKWPKWIQTSQNSPKGLKNPKFHLF